MKDTYSLKHLLPGSLQKKFADPYVEEYLLILKVAICQRKTRLQNYIHFYLLHIHIYVYVHMYVYCMYAHKKDIQQMLKFVPRTIGLRLILFSSVYLFKVSGFLK